MGGVPTLARGYLPWMENTYPGCRVPTLDGVPPPPGDSRASTCCVTGGMLLAFTQEDILLGYLFAIPRSAFRAFRAKDNSDSSAMSKCNNNKNISK